MEPEVQAFKSYIDAFSFMDEATRSLVLSFYEDLLLVGGLKELQLKHPHLARRGAWLCGFSFRMMKKYERNFKDVDGNIGGKARRELYRQLGQKTTDKAVQEECRKHREYQEAEILRDESEAFHVMVEKLWRAVEHRNDNLKEASFLESNEMKLDK